MVTSPVDPSHCYLLPHTRKNGLERCKREMVWERQECPRALIRLLGPRRGLSKSRTITPSICISQTVDRTAHLFLWTPCESNKRQASDVENRLVVVGLWVMGYRWYGKIGEVQVKIGKV